VYDSDPVTHKDAAFIKETRYMTVLEKRLNIMDMTAISLAMSNELPIIVFNLTRRGNIKRVVMGEDIGTLIH
jgi:uridylate kinase